MLQDVEEGKNIHQLLVFYLPYKTLLVLYTYAYKLAMGNEPRIGQHT